MQNFRKILAFQFLSVMAHTASGQQVMTEPDLMQLYPSEEIVEIATGTAKPIHLAPSVATVITAKEIKAMNWRTLDEALESVPGLHVSYSSNRLNSIYSIRGLHTSQNPQVLLLVNGLPFNDIITGSRPPLFRLPVENISRIEIVRGPGSAVFGADAFAGVINVITKSADDIRGLSAGLRAGSFDTQDAWIQYGARLFGWDLAASVESSRSDGDNDRRVNADLQTSFDSLFSTNASLAPGSLSTGYRLLNSSLTASHEHWSIWFNSWNLADAGVGPGAAQALDPNGKQDVDQYALLVNYADDGISENWKIDTRLAYRVMDQQAYFQLLPPGTVVPIGSDGNLLTPPFSIVNFPDGILGNPGGKLTNTRLEFAATYSGLLYHRLRLAVGTDHNEAAGRESKNFGPGVIDGSSSPIDGTLTDVTGTPYVFAPDRSRTDNYVSLQDEWRIAPDWELTAGVRYDDYSDFGETVNPRLALVWATDYNLTSKLLYGRASRAPSLTELYFRNNPAVIGNPNLKPETLDMLEMVFDYRPTLDLKAVLSLFAYQADDMITFDSNNIAANSHSQEGHGLELSGTWDLNSTIQFTGNYALQVSKDKTSHDTIPDAPRQTVYAGVRWRPTLTWSGELQTRWVAGRTRPAQDTRPNIDDYFLVDMGLRYKPATSTWELAAFARNILDEDAREPSNGVIPDDYPLPGRALFIEGRVHVD